MSGEMIFGLIFILFFGTMAVFSLIAILNPDESQPRIKMVLVLLFNLFLVYIGIYFFLLGYNLQNNYVYVDGTTIDYCHSGKYGSSNNAIEFEYYLNGTRYTNCNSYADISRIKVPDGEFKVKVTPYKPDVGRIDFEKPLTDDSIRNR